MPLIVSHHPSGSHLVILCEQCHAAIYSAEEGTLSWGNGARWHGSICAFLHMWCVEEFWQKKGTTCTLMPLHMLPFCLCDTLSIDFYRVNARGWMCSAD
jgi:hypothetical protein